MKKVSVIVPVYNTEKYLSKCLDSLVKQTLSDIEIIVVNDESPDNSQKIIDKYMPGALTIILNKKNNVSNVLTSNLDTVGVRIPNNEIALRILRIKSQSAYHTTYI